MNEPTQLVEQSNGSRDLGSALERPLSPYPPYGSYPEQTSSGYNRLRDYWRSVRKNIWLVIGIVVLVSLLSAIYTARQPDVYESLSRVQVDLETANNPAIGALKGNPIFLNNPSQDPTYFNTQIQILTSAGLLGRVAKTLDLEHNEAFLRPQLSQKPSIWQSAKRLVGADKTVAQPRQQVENKLRVGSAISTDDGAEANRLEPYVEILKGQLNVKPLNETRIIEIRFKHQDPEIAQRVNNMIAHTFVVSNLERKTETSNSAGDFLQKRIAELQSEIRRREEELINYAKNHQILTLDASQNTVVDRLTGLNKQLLEAENDRKAAEATYRAALAPGALEAQAEADNDAFGALDTKRAELKRQRALLLLEYTEKYPEVRDLDQQIAMLEKQADQLRTHSQTVVKTNLQTKYQQALQTEQALREAFNKQRGETFTQNEAAVNYRIIQQEIDTNKTLLDGLLQRSKENDVILAGTPNNIHVVDYASQPKGPVGPKRMQTIALATLLSLLLAIALARFLDYLDDSIHSTQDVETYLRLPALAVIPTIGRQARRRLLAVIPGKLGTNGHGGAELLIHESPRSPLAESFRQLRTSVLLAAAGGAPKTLLVTSSQPSEGKTTTVVNTAMILAQTGAKVLIVDADMRRPRLHSIFDMENSTGLSGILSSRMTDAEMLAEVRHHEESGLHILPSGRIPPNPAELLGSDQMRSLMGVLANSFTYIVIDSPPIASFTDGVLLSSLADGVLLVVHGGVASRHIIRRSRQLLTEVGAKIFGVVLNNVTVSSHDYYYNRNYEHYYYASGGGEDDELPSSPVGP
ncbi:MAG: polysaccharide biosynthesis tyrosine autokinase [Acidobacteriota bacterium]